MIVPFPLRLRNSRSVVRVLAGSGFFGENRLIRTIRGQIPRVRGFTLIELLTALLILSVLLAVALALYLNAVSYSERGTCRTNMQTIGNAVHANRIAQRLPSYPLGAVNAAYISASAPDLLAVPSCPTGGTYTVIAGSGGAPFDVTCTDAAHGRYRYGIDPN